MLSMFRLTCYLILVLIVSEASVVNELSRLKNVIESFKTTGNFVRIERKSINHIKDDLFVIDENFNVVGKNSERHICCSYLCLNDNGVPIMSAHNGGSGIIFDCSTILIRKVFPCDISCEGLNTADVKICDPNCLLSVKKLNDLKKVIGHDDVINRRIKNIEMTKAKSVANIRFGLNGIDYYLKMHRTPSRNDMIGIKKEFLEDYKIMMINPQQYLNIVKHSPDEWLFKVDGFKGLQRDFEKYPRLQLNESELCAIDKDAKIKITEIFFSIQNYGDLIFLNNWIKRKIISNQRFLLVLFPSGFKVLDCNTFQKKFLDDNFEFRDRKIRTIINSIHDAYMVNIGVVKFFRRLISKYCSRCCRTQENWHKEEFDELCNMFFDNSFCKTIEEWFDVVNNLNLT